ncbi:MAG TPA: cysteine desulfurase family protein [Vicinamibacterales bacterium]|nr:cysteine desulfurase [Acidobacteriota bacterium]HOC17007.1 cysteine desulfurase family protein [Vicinamibacterales bacterium]
MVPVYLDHNATTPVAPEVAEAVASALHDTFGNASSLHAPGQRARRALDEARQAVAALVGADPAGIVFTSGGTESDNLAVRGALEAAPATRRRLVVGAVEHEAVLNTALALQRRGWPVTIVPVTSDGVVTPEALAPHLGPDVALVSVMLANNETGVVQPVAALASLAHAAGARFHTDAVQAIGKIEVDVRELDVDLLSLTGHKFGGPKGAGALWIRRGVPMAGVLTGGRQERNRRPGTENVPGIVGLGVAAELAAGSRNKRAAVAGRRDRLERAVLAAVPGSVVNGAGAGRVPNTTNISFPGAEAESLLIALDLEGIAVSSGSACSSGTLEPSHVLRAMGLPPARVQSAIRFSLGPATTDEDIDRVLAVLPGVVERIRRVL